MKLGLVRGVLVLLVGLGVAAVSSAAVPWFPLGPYGGDARSISPDPHDPRHLYLGTANGWVYESHDGGLMWKRVAQINRLNDLVIDHLLVDPSNSQRLVVGAWRDEGGGIFISNDGGKTWYDQAQMHGQSVRSMARSLSDPNEIVVGTLSGVFRSKDNGAHWVQISPIGSTEIHKVMSIAIDARNENLIYAGTTHLPWRTTNGGATWENVKEGIIDDSDVFSIIIDPVRPNVVYASACSGIYKSVTGGNPNPADQDKRFDKVQGIPSTARRTRKLMQDPENRETVFAGTTQGLYRTLDGGREWERLTADDVIVNDVYVDPRNSNHVLLATDRGGVLRSEDAGVTFEASNTGFSARHVTAYAADPHNAGRLYVGMVNDKTMGGVFESTDGGLLWQQTSTGLNGRDVFSLMAMGDGAVLAGTAHGILRLQDGAWTESDDLLPPPAPVKKPASKPSGKSPSGKTPASKSSVSSRKRAAKPAVTPPPAAAPTHIDGEVYSLQPLHESVLAATAGGLVRSMDEGHTWQAMPGLVMPDTEFVDARNNMVLVGSLKRLALSMDDGKSWDTVALPKDLTQIGALALDDAGNLWVGGREGAYYSTDYGETWKTLNSLYITQVDSLFFDAASHRMLVTSAGSNYVFEVALPDLKVTYSDAGWLLRFARPVGDHLIGATLFDGMVVQPRMVDSQFAGGKAAGK